MECKRCGMPLWFCRWARVHDEKNRRALVQYAPGTLGHYLEWMHQLKHSLGVERFWDGWLFYPCDYRDLYLDGLSPAEAFREALR